MPIKWRTWALLMLAYVAVAAVPVLESSFQDFKAFYCAGQVLYGGHDPYLVEPLRSCEFKVEEELGHPPVRGAVYLIPAPIPIYEMGIFAGGGAPFRLSLGLYLAACLTGFLCSVWAMSRIVRKPPIIVGLILLPSMTVSSFLSGQLTPIAVGFLCLSALALHRGKDQAAGLLTAGLFLHPQIGLAVALTIFAWKPKARAAIAAVVLTLAVIQFAGGGLHGSLRYFGTILPHQAAAEVHNRGQLSVTSLLAILGVDDKAALAGGQVAYLICVTLALAASKRIAALVSTEAMLALIPAALATVGSYVHLSQVAMAVPAALAFAALTPNYYLLATLSLMALALPWMDAFGQDYAPVFRVSMTAVTAAAVSMLNEPFILRRTLYAVGAALILLIAVGSSLPKGPQPYNQVRLNITPGELATDAWAPLVECCFLNDRIGYTVVRTPTWFGLGGLLCLTLLLTRRQAKRRDAPAGGEAVAH